MQLLANGLIEAQSGPVTRSRSETASPYHESASSAAQRAAATVHTDSEIGSNIDSNRSDSATATESATATPNSKTLDALVGRNVTGNCVCVCVCV